MYIIKSRSANYFVGMVQGEWMWTTCRQDAYVFMWESVARAICDHISQLTKVPMEGYIENN